MAASVHPLGSPERLLDSATEAILILSSEGQVLWRNRTAHEALEAELGRSCLGLPFNEMWVAQSEVESGLEIASRQKSWGFRGRTASDETDLIIWEGQITSAESSRPSDTLLLVVLRDITAQVRRESELIWNANFDPLTELPNRITFRNMLDAAVGEGLPVTLALLDADQLKRTNDTDGQNGGDNLLRNISVRLRSVEHPRALSARLGGDEFALLVEDHLQSEQLEEILEKLCRPSQPQGFTLPFSASAGVAISSRSGTTANDLMQHADLALNEAKARGRASWQIFDHEMRRRQQAKLAAIALLRRALEQGWAVPFYQPKVNLISGRIIGFEALLRIQRPDGSLHTAGMISEALQEADLAAEVDRVILRSVLADLRHWQKLGVALPVAVNLTDATLRLASFAEELLASLTAAEISTSLLQVEITETVLLDGSDDAVQSNLRALNQAGINMSLDDFGTGFASLSHLRIYPVDEIKIDRRFVEAVLTSPDDQAIISAIAGLGDRLSMTVIAEGVETDAQRRLLIEAGCEFGQGYFFSSAISADGVGGLFGSTLGVSNQSGEAGEGA